MSYCNLKLQLFAKRGDGSSGRETAQQLRERLFKEEQEHFAREYEQIDKWLNSSGDKNTEFEVGDGKILSHYSMEEAKFLLGDAIVDGVIAPETSVLIHYKNGKYDYFHEGDEFNVNMSKVNGISLEDGYQTGLAGKGFTFENYTAEYWSQEKGYEPGEVGGFEDWRVVPTNEAQRNIRKKSGK